LTEKYNELKLYSPLTAELVTDEPDQDWGYLDVPDYAQNLDGQDLVEFRKVIEQGIADEVLPEEAERGLMAWYIQKDSINAKVHSLWVGVEEINGRLYGVATCEVKDKLTPDELAELKEFCAGQYADGWGEGFEQRERHCADGELYVHFYQPDKFFICTKEEMEQNRRRQQNKNVQKGGEAR
jgi:hypothetical protein